MSQLQWIGKRDGENYETAFLDEGRRPNFEALAREKVKTSVIARKLKRSVGRHISKLQARRDAGNSPTEEKSITA